MLTTTNAHAFCGFYVAPDQDKPLYNDASLVALMRDGTRTVLTMSNAYKGPAKDFAMVVPVPVVLQKENVKTLPKDVFAKLEQLTAPRLVEYWEEDPCAWYGANGEIGGVGYGSGAGSAMGAGGFGGKVTIEAKFSVGEYDIVILGAKESDALETWLVQNGYKIPAGASAALAPYVKEQQKFFVAKVDVKKVKMDAQGAAMLSPLRMTYESVDFRLPVRLGLLNAKQKQDLIVFTLSKTKRYDVANYTNAFIPTNLDVTDATRKSFPEFYAALFDKTVEEAGGKAIVTEYAWSSSSCDPCPGPTLGNEDIATLGGDVLFGKSYQPSLVITRLHARYDNKTLGDDLIFRAAEPIEGGREMALDDKGTLDHGMKIAKYGANNFQARYAIRHPWTGPIKCKFPKRGTWGEPPAWMTNSKGPDKAVGATGLAAAPRGGVKLDTMLKTPFPAVVIETALASTAPASDPGDAGVDTEAGAPQDASFGPSGAPSVAPLPAPAQRGCACEVLGAGNDEGDRRLSTIVFMGTLAAFAARKKRRIN